VIAITGASGFIGSRLLAYLLQERIPTRVLVRERSSLPAGAFEVEEGDMRDPTAFARLVVPGCTWLNLAHPQFNSANERSHTLSQLVEICRRKRARRIVHCSSAVVVGRTSDERVNESTPCQPGNAYEASKLAMERSLFANAQTLQIAVLRPTAVFGPGGRNLVKLAHDLQHRPRWLNYLKSCMQGERRMNLVHVDNVVAALAFLAGADNVDREVFIISDDEHAANNYRDVERALLRELGLPEYRAPRLRLASVILPAMLRLAGRTNVNPWRVYDGSKILARGLKKPVAFGEGLRDFARWYCGR
jgi:nucleoside-diphosphate-sugar epimerase